MLEGGKQLLNLATEFGIGTGQLSQKLIKRLAAGSVKELVVRKAAAFFSQRDPVKKFAFISTWVGKLRYG